MSGPPATRTRPVIGTAMESAAQAHPRDPQIFIGADGLSSYTLGEINARAHALAAALRQRGVAAGDAIAVQMPNWPEAMIAVRASYVLGACVVLIPHIYREQETRFIVRDSGAKVLISAVRWRSIDYGAHFETVREESKLELIVTVRASAPGTVSFEELDEEGQRLGVRLDPAGARTKPDDLAFVIYTSGSTAVPKGARHSHERYLTEIEQLYGGDHMDGRVWLDGLPYGHMTGFLEVTRPLLCGGPSVVLEHWNAAAALEAVRDHGANAGILPPFHLRTLIDAADEAGVRLQMTDVGSGSTAVQPSLIEEACAKGIEAYRLYGSSEHPTVSIGAPVGPVHDRAYTDGPVAQGCEVRIVDDTSRDVPTGEEGEIWSRGSEMFLGYTDPAATEEAIAPEGWYRSGDLGYLREGVLTVTGRIKDIIIRGGENLSPKEIEDVLVRHPAVIQAAVVGKPDPRYGERTWAFVTTRDHAELTLDEVRRHFAASGVSIQKTPEGVEVIDEFPRTAAGKIRKPDLRARFQ
jgi:acyl-CoA synthetase (AMP-forming)/AMP-acid ligase II